MSRSGFGAAAALLAMLYICGDAFAQAYPSRPVGNFRDE